MRIKPWLVASILAASFTTVATAQEIDWTESRRRVRKESPRYLATCTATVFPAPI